MGPIPQGLPSLTLPDAALAQALRPGAMGIAQMSFTESIAAGRAFVGPDEEGQGRGTSIAEEKSLRSPSGRFALCTGWGPGTSNLKRKVDLTADRGLGVQAHGRALATPLL